MSTWIIGFLTLLFACVIYHFWIVYEEVVTTVFFLLLFLVLLIYVPYFIGWLVLL